MVQPFEEAAFALPGRDQRAGGDAVRVPHHQGRGQAAAGLRDAARRVPQQYIGQLYAEAEESYLTELTERKQLEVQDGAVDVARELARKPSTN
jgi:hypothetical protein